MGTLILRPQGSGTPSPYHVLSSFPTTEANQHYTLVNEVTANDDTNYVYSTSAIRAGSFYDFLTTETYGTISKMRVHCSFKYAGTPGTDEMGIRVIVNDASVLHESGIIYLDLDGAGAYHAQYADYTEAWEGQPFTWDMFQLYTGKGIYVYICPGVYDLDYIRATQLYIEIFYDPGDPTVTSGGDCGAGVCVNGIADQILSNSMVCCGSVDEDGGGTITEVGFEYGESEEDMWAVRQTGTDLGTGEFKLPIGCLKPSTLYHIRFFATNETGTTYGNWKTATTKAEPSYGMHEEDNSPTICFYLSEDNGMTWGQKHGPYTEGQADIEVTKLLVRGSGKKKIKFESDVLTGISASVMVKLDLKAR